MRGAGESGEDGSEFIGSLGMSHPVMAADAGKAVIFVSAAGIDGVGDVCVTVPAGVFRDGAAARFHIDRLMEITGREGVRMPETVIGLGPVLAEEIVRGVAIIASGDGTVAGLQPGVIVILHDMAVRACLRIVGEVGAAAGVDKGVPADPGREAEQDSERDGRGANASTRIHSVADKAPARPPWVGPRRDLNGE